MSTELRVKYICHEGQEFPCVETDRNEEGDALLELELKKRIIKLRMNIEKCGSFEELERIGGKPTSNFLRSTRNQLRWFLVYYQTSYLLTTEEDLSDAAAAVNASDKIYSLVEQASWSEIISYAQELRNSLVDKWFQRTLSRNTMLQVA